MTKRLVFAALALTLVAGCAGTQDQGRSGRGYAHGTPGQNGQPQATPYADPLFEDALDEAMSRYVLSNLPPGRKVFWFNPGKDKVVFVQIKAAPVRETNKPAEIAVVTKKRDGRLALIAAKAGPEAGDAWKVYSAFAAQLDENGQKLLEADYREAYRRASSPPPLAVPADAGGQAAVQPQGQGLPPGAPAGLFAADDLDFPAPQAAKPAHSGPPPGGGKRGRGGMGGPAGPGGRTTGGGVLGGMGM